MGARDDLFEHTFRDSPIGMAILDPSGQYVEVNDAFATILGRARDQVVGRSYREFTHPDDVARDDELMTKLADGHLDHYQIHKRVLHRDGDTLWVRVTVSSVHHSSTPGDYHYVAQVEDVTEIRRARDLLERRALYDHLTGLANRTLLMERLERALDTHAGRAATVACVFVDVDHFKVINDSLGHDAGDVLLATIARRIEAKVRTADTVARLGGDEFVVVLEDVMTVEDATAVMDAIADAVREPVSLEGQDVTPTVSAGLAIATSTVTAETLVRNADTAMYAAKEAGRGRTEVFDDSMRSMALTRLSIESELRAAIRSGELTVHYQPLVNLDTREIEAFEALVRWNHPHRGLLLPDEFIPISEDANLVVPLGAIVLHEACSFLAARPDYHGKVFVNVSTRQIGAANLASVVRHALEATGANPAQLGIEITESGMLMATGAARADLKAIVDLGAHLIIDDFGTGYSALSSVLQNPVAGLKLAREFTLRLGDRGAGDRISTAISTLTRSLNMFGVIEGIETESQAATARRHGWHLGQGFLFGHAQPAELIDVGLPHASQADHTHEAQGASPLP